MSRRAKGFGTASHCDFHDGDVVICDGDLTIRDAEKHRMNSSPDTSE